MKVPVAMMLSAIFLNDRRVKDAMKRLGYEQVSKWVKGKAVKGYVGCKIELQYDTETDKFIDQYWKV